MMLDQVIRTANQPIHRKEPVRSAIISRLYLSTLRHAFIWQFSQDKEKTDGHIWLGGSNPSNAFLTTARRT